MLRTFIAALVLGGTVASASAADIVLKFSSWLPPTHYLLTDVLKPWFTDVEKVTEGRVKIDLLPKVVGTAASQFDVVRDELADMSFIVPSYTPGRFVSLEFAELPLLGNNAAIMSRELDKVFVEKLQALPELAGVTALAVMATTPVHVMTVSKDIATVEDFKGLKMRAGSPMVNTILETLGAVSIVKSSAETVELLSAGAIDGQVTTISTVTAFNQTQYMKHLITMPGGFGSFVDIVGINSNKWAQIAPADQEAILKISRDRLSEALGARFDRADAEAVTALKAAGYTIEEMAPDQVDRLKTTLQPIVDDWLKRAEERSIPDPKGLLDTYRKAVAG